MSDGTITPERTMAEGVVWMSSSREVTLGDGGWAPDGYSQRGSWLRVCLLWVSETVFARRN